MHRAASGEADAFAVLMQRYNQRLYRLAMSVLGDASEAEDALQESYLRAYYRLSSFNGHASLGAWLAQIVRNEAIDRLRARSARNNLYSIEADMMAGEEERVIGVADRAGADDPQVDPEALASREEVRRVLERAICCLPAPFRAVFVLREVEGLSVQETADYLGIPPATVKTRDHRARLLLRAYVGQQMDATARDAFVFLGARCAGLVQSVLARLRG